MNAPGNLTPLPETFFKYALTVGVILIGLAIVDNIDRRLGTLYVIVILLGVALTHRAGVQAFTTFLVTHTQGVK